MSPLTLYFPVRAISKDNEKIFNRNSRRPFTSKRFKEFEETLRRYAKAQIPKWFKRYDTESLHVSLTFNFKNKVHADCGNLPKGVLDAFNKVIWKDDRQIKGLVVDVYEDKKSNECIMMRVQKC